MGWPLESAETSTGTVKVGSGRAQGKQTVTLKFQAADAAWAGGVLGVRITKVPSAK